MDLADKLIAHGDLPDAPLASLISSDKFDDKLRTAADKIRRAHYSDLVYLRGLIEFTNYCKRECYYCGIRKSNKHIERYRLTQEEILQCCREGYRLGFRTFVLQGGEDPFYTDDKICSIVAAIRKEFKDCAITLSIGEKSRESYKAYFDAGANRYLLRHESADPAHYKMLHPDSLSLENRIRCLFDLKSIGYQVGSGFMVGSPFQKTEYLVEDIRFLQELKPDMIGIGPFVNSADTPFANFPSGSVELTLRLISILRIIFPYALIPSTTALGTIDPQGREKGLKAGANVVMPNLSPSDVRDKYALYNGKICTGEESAQCRSCLDSRIKTAGYQSTVARGDVKKKSE